MVFDFCRQCQSIQHALLHAPTVPAERLQARCAGAGYQGGKRLLSRAFTTAASARMPLSTGRWTPLDYELVDIFNWQEEAAGMISQMEFVRRVDVQTETIERYVRDGLLVPDLVVPMSEHRTFKYFKEETLQKYANNTAGRSSTPPTARIFFWIWCGRWT